MDMCSSLIATSSSVLMLVPYVWWASRRSWGSPHLYLCTQRRSRPHRSSFAADIYRLYVDSNIDKLLVYRSHVLSIGLFWDKEEIRSKNITYLSSFLFVNLIEAIVNRVRIISMGRRLKEVDTYRRIRYV